MIHRDKIIVAMPCYNSLIDAGCVNGMLACAPFYARPLIFAGNSSIALARNEIANIFVESTDADWLMWIDADTRFTPDDWNLLWEDGDSVDIVCAEYARKVLGLPPVQFGLGFTRIHRRVFEAIKKLTHEDGAERVNRFYHKGQVYVDYHPNGAMQSGKWIGEDQGFFMWAGLAEAKLRVETRTKLKHVGTLPYDYPEQINAATLVELFKLLPIDSKELFIKSVEGDGAQ